MQVYKFGGASIKNADAVKNLRRIIEDFEGQGLIIILSAMGKTTNALENMLSQKSGKTLDRSIEDLYAFHQKIIDELFETKVDVNSSVNTLFGTLSFALNNPSTNHKLQYDKVVCHGELLSTTIVHHFLNSTNIGSEFVDARDCIITDNSFMEAHVNWEATKNEIQNRIPKLLEKKHVITQGFIGRSKSGESTTIGREGSDFTGAIFASCMKAEKLTIWKDVSGILTADPKKHPDATKFDHLSYHEAAEMTYYGASVIHPKTIKPLANSNIPLHVRSFEFSDQAGTIIHGHENTELLPSIIYKPGQTLISFSVKDFSFINEANLSMIFHNLSENMVKINLMQNSAISLTVCVDSKSLNPSAILSSIGDHFEIRYNTNLQLITVKNFDEITINKILKGVNKDIYLEQKTRNNYRIVIDQIN